MSKHKADKNQPKSDKPRKKTVKIPDPINLKGRPHEIIEKYRSEAIDGGRVVQRHYMGRKTGNWYMYQSINDGLGKVEAREWFHMNPPVIEDNRDKAPTEEAAS